MFIISVTHDEFTASMSQIQIVNENVGQDHATAVHLELNIKYFARLKENINMQLNLVICFKSHIENIKTENNEHIEICHIYRKNN